VRLIIRCRYSRCQISKCVLLLFRRLQTLYVQLKPVVLAVSFRALARRFPPLKIQWQTSVKMWQLKRKQLLNYSVTKQLIGFVAALLRFSRLVVLNKDHSGVAQRVNQRFTCFYNDCFTFLRRR